MSLEYHHAQAMSYKKGLWLVLQFELGRLGFKMAAAIAFRTAT